jgi:hypothetical protein
MEALILIAGTLASAAYVTVVFSIAKSRYLHIRKYQ